MTSHYPDYTKFRHFEPGLRIIRIRRNRQHRQHREQRAASRIGYARHPQTKPARTEVPTRAAPNPSGSKPELTIAIDIDEQPTSRPPQGSKARSCSFILRKGHPNRSPKSIQPRLSGAIRTLLRDDGLRSPHAINTTFPGFEPGLEPPATIRADLRI